MVNRLIIPNPQFADGTGLPYANGKLQFFATGTATPLATYSDSALTIPNANPIILDSAGRSGSVFLQNLAYKVQLFDVNNVQIWSIDPVWSSDYSGVAQFAVNNGSPNGNVAGTAGTFGGLPSSVIWDATNNVLYVCTTTGNAATAVWTAVNAASSGAGVLGMPGGRLTPTTGVPVIVADAISATSVFYTPYKGNQIPIWGGSAFTMQTFAELTLTLNSGVHAINTIYDIFVFNNSGTLTVATGPAWTNSAAGTGARGSGAGTTQLTLFGGINVNTVQITGRNGGSTFTIPALTATYVGSILIDGTAGQVTCHVTAGQLRRFGLWNAHNRVTTNLQVADNTASWTLNGASRNSNNSASNSFLTFSGLPEERCYLDFCQVITTGGSGQANIYIAVNGTQQGFRGGVPGTAAAMSGVISARHTLQGTIGINTIQAQESSGGGNTCTFFAGGVASMMLSGVWQA